MFYVYELADPRTGMAFYCGKGQGNRAYQHQREVANGTAKSNQAKIDKIWEILCSGYQVDVRIVAEFDNEEDALYEEYLRIEANKNLTNRMPGGLNTKPSPVTQARMDIDRLNNLEAKLVATKRKLLAIQELGIAPKVKIGKMVVKPRGKRRHIAVESYESNDPRLVERLRNLRIRLHNVRKARDDARLRYAKLKSNLT